MTSEILIMNKEAVALAADSAVTLSQQKIFTSANKIFRLSDSLPVGVMVYNKAEFMGVPWETIVKLFRDNFDKNGYESIEIYSEKFRSFLLDQFKENEQEDFFDEESSVILINIRHRIEKIIKLFVKIKGKTSDSETKLICQNVIYPDFKIWNDMDFFSQDCENLLKKFEKKYGKILSGKINKMFTEIPLSRDLTIKLKKIVFFHFLKYDEDHGNPLTSGVIIAGFGNNEIFPAYNESLCIGIVDGELLFFNKKSYRIPDDTLGHISPFAQHEMVDMFMTGIDPDYLDSIEEFNKDIFTKYPLLICEILEKELVARKLIQPIEDTVRKNILKKIVLFGKERFKESSKIWYDYRDENYVQNIMNVVGNLPKDELAFMAESLVSLTSFKRKVSMQTESVSGPIDVVIISKKDGFIWIKKKHYFKSELNPHFFRHNWKVGDNR